MIQPQYQMLNDQTYIDDSFSLKKYSELSEVKITVGKKKIGILKIL